MWGSKTVFPQKLGIKVSNGPLGAAFTLCWLGASESVLAIVIARQLSVEPKSRKWSKKWSQHMTQDVKIGQKSPKTAPVMSYGRSVCQNVRNLDTEFDCHDQSS